MIDGSARQFVSAFLGPRLITRSEPAGERASWLSDFLGALAGEPRIPSDAANQSLGSVQRASYESGSPRRTGRVLRNGLVAVAGLVLVVALVFGLIFAVSNGLLPGMFFASAGGLAVLIAVAVIVGVVLDNGGRTAAWDRIAAARHINADLAREQAERGLQLSERERRLADREAMLKRRADESTDGSEQRRQEGGTVS